MTSERRLPVPWYQRPQLWSTRLSDPEGDEMTVAAAAWRIVELTRDDRLVRRTVQPTEGEDDDESV